MLCRTDTQREPGGHLTLTNCFQRWIMKARLIIASVSAVAMTLLVSLFVAIQPAQAAVGLRITNGRLVEANGNPFVMRGTSHAHVWYQNQTSSFANIKSLGANTVRVVLSGGRWTPVNGV